MAWYERQPWLRAVVQAFPVLGGSADTMLAWRGTVLGQRRFMELIADVSSRVAELETTGPVDSLLEDDRFVELFKIAAETATASASVEKRKRASALLAGTLLSGTVSDLSNQIARDLAILDDFHLIILASLPPAAHRPINTILRPPGSAPSQTWFIRKASLTSNASVSFVTIPWTLVL